jgi:large subunit ribosomal protein L15
MLLGTEMGKHGFVKLPLSEELEVVNVDVLDQMAGPDGKIELSKMKVLGRGKVTRTLNVSAAGFTATAKSKIEAAGGQAVVV